MKTAVLVISLLTMCVGVYQVKAANIEDLKIIRKCDGQNFVELHLRSSKSTVFDKMDLTLISNYNYHFEICISSYHTQPDSLFIFRYPISLPTKCYVTVSATLNVGVAGACTQNYLDNKQIYKEFKDTNPFEIVTAGLFVLNKNNHLSYLKRSRMHLEKDIITHSIVQSRVGDTIYIEEILIDSFVWPPPAIPSIPLFIDTGNYVLIYTALHKLEKCRKYAKSDTLVFSKVLNDTVTPFGAIGTKRWFSVYHSWSIEVTVATSEIIAHQNLFEWPFAVYKWHGRGSCTDAEKYTMRQGNYIFGITDASLSTIVHLGFVKPEPGDVFTELNHRVLFTFRYDSSSSYPLADTALTQDYYRITLRNTPFDGTIALRTIRGLADYTGYLAYATMGYCDESYLSILRCFQYPDKPLLKMFSKDCEWTNVGHAEERGESHEIQVYPNPTNDIVFADFSTSDDPYTLELTNGHGRVVRRFVVSNTGQFPVQLPEEAGIYYLRVVSELELPQCIKVVKY